MTDPSPLFTPARLGSLDIPNRVLMSPLTRNRAHPDGTPSDIAVTYYRQRASAGLILSEATQVTPKGKGYIDTPGIHTDAHVAGWRRITDAVHANGGRIYCQLWHVGRISHVSLQPDGRAPLAPSAIAADAQSFTPDGFQDASTPEALDDAGIAETLAAYRDGAAKAREAGFDGVEVHAANGYLIDQFLQDGANLRDDRYGGPIENRMRFIEEVLDAVGETWERGRVGVHLSPLGQANGISDSDPETLFAAVYRKLDARQLGYLHVVESFPDAERSAEEVAMLGRLRPLYTGAYLANGGYDGASGARAVAEGHAMAVAYGRPFIANPDLPERFRIGAALNPPERETFYGGGAGGYTDYSFLPAAA